MTTPLKIAIAGLGTVGVGVVKLLQQEAALLQARAGRPLELVAVNARSKDKDRVVTFGDAQWIDDAQALADTDADLVVELIGGSEGVAKSLLEASLAKGKSVVTANKALIAHHGAALATLAEANNAQLRFDAAVAGGIPIIDVMQYGVVANRFTRVAGILNGTGNYILTTMQKDGRDFDEVLKEAQELGYAEADPSFDVDGIDTAHKLAILCALAYSTQPNLDAITIEGIRSVSALDMRYAAELGYVIKLLGVAEQTEYGIMQRVHPCMVPADAPIGRIDGAFNAVQLEGLAVGRVLLEGQGAGEGPTASSVVSDIVQIARGSQTHAFTLRAADLAPLTPAHMSQLQSSYYLRLSVRDEP
jgi:homoserine dehydrogenase